MSLDDIEAGNEWAARPVLHHGAAEKCAEAVVVPPLSPLDSSQFGSHSLSLSLQLGWRKPPSANASPGPTTFRHVVWRPITFHHVVWQ